MAQDEVFWFAVYILIAFLIGLSYMALLSGSWQIKTGIVLAYFVLIVVVSEPWKWNTHHIDYIYVGTTVLFAAFWFGPLYIPKGHSYADSDFLFASLAFNICVVSGLLSGVDIPRFVVWASFLISTLLIVAALGGYQIPRLARNKPVTPRWPSTWVNPPLDVRKVCRTCRETLDDPTTCTHVADPVSSRTRSSKKTY